MITPALIAAVMAGRGAGSGGLTCPDYSTVTLSLTSSIYSAPVAPNINLQLLPCLYSAPLV